MLNKIISLVDGFLIGFCLLQLSDSMVYVVPLACGIVIIICNFTGVGE